MYLRRITEEEGLVIIAKTRRDSGARAARLTAVSHWYGHIN